MATTDEAARLENPPLDIERTILGRRDHSPAERVCRDSLGEVTVRRTVCGPLLERPLLVCAAKQVDRLLSNSGIDTAAAQQQWTRHIVGERKQLVVALDWTEFDRDGHSTIALSLLTSHGRATPLIWKSVAKSELKSELKNQRNDFETEAIERLHEALPTEVEVTLFADRGFGDQKRYAVLDLLGWYYVIRFRAGIFVTDAKGERRTAKQWLHPSGRSRILHGATVSTKAGQF